MNISFRSRHKKMIACTVFAVALGGGAAAFGAGASAASAAVGTATITDSLTGTVTAPDDIVNCTPTQIAIGGTEAVAMPVKCLTEYNGEWVTVTWSGTGGVTTKLTEQTDGNFVLYAGSKKWGAATRFADNANGPGCIANFQGDANLVVRNCGGTAIWESGTHTFPDAVLAFQADGNLVIYQSTAGTALWSTKTS